MKLLRDTWLLFVNNLTETLRNPVWVIIGLFQPICYLLLFGPLLEGVAGSGNFPPGGALTVFTPGMLIMLGMFGGAFVGFGLIADLRAGIVERLRVTPVSRLAPLLARSLRDVIILLVQAIIFIVAALPLGLKPDFWGIVLTLGLIVLLGLILSSCSYALALAFKSEDALAPMLNFFINPILLLSGILLPLTLAPEWLRIVANFNPFSHVVDAARAAFVGDFANSSIVWGFVITIVLAGLALFWAARSFRQATT